MRPIVGHLATVSSIQHRNYQGVSHLLRRVDDVGRKDGRDGELSISHIDHLRNLSKQMVAAFIFTPTRQSTWQNAIRLSCNFRLGEERLKSCENAILMLVFWRRMGTQVVVVDVDIPCNSSTQEKLDCPHR